MPTLTKVIDAYAASSPTLDRASLARLEFWCTALGDREIATITAEHVDDALVMLAARGRLAPRRGKVAAGTGRPYSGATLNRYLSTLGTVFKYARRLRLVPRAHDSPRGGRAPEPAAGRIALSNGRSDYVTEMDDKQCRDDATFPDAHDRAPISRTWHINEKGNGRYRQALCQGQPSFRTG
jgi:hypothetical protein